MRKAIRTARCSWASGRCSSATSTTTSARRRTRTRSSATRATSKRAGGIATCSSTAGSAWGLERRCCALVLGLWWGLLAAGIHAVMYVFVLSSSINGLCHYLGYRNFDNTATNVRFVALLTGGEGLHNNHHGPSAQSEVQLAQKRQRRDRSGLARHQAAHRAPPREALQDHRRNRRVGRPEGHYAFRRRRRRRRRLRRPYGSSPAPGCGCATLPTVSPRSSLPSTGASPSEATSARTPCQCSMSAGAWPWISSQVSALGKTPRCTSDCCTRGCAPRSRSRRCSISAWRRPSTSPRASGSSPSLSGGGFRGLRCPRVVAGACDSSCGCSPRSGNPSGTMSEPRMTAFVSVSGVASNVLRYASSSASDCQSGGPAL